MRFVHALAGLFAVPSSMLANTVPVSLAIQLRGVSDRLWPYSTISTSARASRLIVHCVSAVSRPMLFCFADDHYGERRAPTGFHVVQHSLQAGAPLELRAADAVVGVHVLVAYRPAATDRERAGEFDLACHGFCLRRHAALFGGFARIDGRVHRWSLGCTTTTVAKFQPMRLSIAISCAGPVRATNPRITTSPRRRTRGPRRLFSCRNRRLLTDEDSLQPERRSQISGALSTSGSRDLKFSTSELSSPHSNALVRI